MAEYIEREALKNNLHCTKEGLFFCGGKTYIDFDVVSKAVLQTPAADVAEVRHAQWVVNEHKEAVCTGCKSRTFEWASWSFDYCPFCGAIMDGKGEGE